VDLLLADPPYDFGTAEVEEALRALTTRGWASAGTVAVVERAAAGPPLRWPARWVVWQERKYGDTRLEMAQLKQPAGWGHLPPEG
jgi:16S rRNA (guanine966-N2)-methyltransferase